MPAKTPVGEWLATPVGRRCFAHEQRLTRQTLDSVFGEQFLQIGAWGGPDAFLRYARTQRKALLCWHGDEPQADLISATECLAIASDSIDAVLLPHTLELTDSPHALLRESDRILRADGHLIVLGFDPNGPWGLRHVLSRRGYPQGHQRMIREGQLCDWLQLLSFEVAQAKSYCHTLPFEQLRQLGTYPRERWAQRWMPPLAGAYMLYAQKRVHPLTPVRPAWKRRRLRAVGGLVEPTTRASRNRECL